MTVILTPLSASSEGLAVIEKTTSGFKVKELRSGTGNYSFDWEVKCVRQGFENYQVVRDIDENQLRNAQKEIREMIWNNNTPKGQESKQPLKSSSKQKSPQSK